MTTATAARQPRTASKTLAVARAYFTNPMTTLVTPLIVVAAILLFNLAIWALVSVNLDSSDRADFQDGLEFSGASSWMFAYMFVVAVQGVASILPFALSYGATRRQFLAASGIVFLALSVAYATLYTVLSALEQATDGWGFGGHMFTAIYFGSGGWAARWLTFFALTLMCLLVGAAFSAVFQRWRVLGLLLTFAVIALVLLGAGTVTTLAEGWDEFGAAVARAWLWGGDLALPLFAAAPAVLGALGGWLVLRRTTIPS